MKTRHAILILALFLGLAGSAFAGPLVYATSTAYESSHIFNAAPANLFYYTVMNHSTTAMTLMIFDATSAPVDGAVTPKICLPVSAATTAIDGIVSQPIFGPYPIQFSTGIVFVLSSGQTCVTKTATANGWFEVGSAAQ